MESFSWEGEDVLARKILHDLFGLARGFYVDIGAHHPINLSNTALLYREGWRGINIDATPGSMAQFRRHRPHDVNLELAVARVAGQRDYVLFSDPALNGFVDTARIAEHASRGLSVVDRVTVQALPLDSILETYAAGRTVHLMNIDVEGAEMEILGSLDFERWRPLLVICEILGARLVEDALKSPLALLMRERGYALISRLHYSGFFIDTRELDRVWPPS